MNDISKQIYKSIYDVYDEIPVSIDEFIENPRYLGKVLNGGKSIYSKWRYHLRKIFEDPYKYSEIIFTGSIGIGKTSVANIIGAYLLYNLLCLKDPKSFFGISASQSSIVFLYFNTTMTKAYKTALGSLYQMLLKSPWFMEHGHESGDRYKTFIPNKNISFEIGSEEQHATSLDIFFFMFDEANDFLHQNADINQTDAMKILNAANQRIRSRFKSADRNTFFGKSLILSSKQSELAFLEQYTKDRLAKNPNGIYIVDEPQWEVLPLNLSGKRFNVAYGNKNAKSRILNDDENIDIVKKQGFKILEVPIEYKKDFDDNINRALTEMGGVSVSYIDKYFSREYVEAATEIKRSNPFSTDIIISGLRDKDEYKDYFNPKMIPNSWVHENVYMHIDTSKSGDKTGISAVSESKDNPNEIHHLFSIDIQAPKDDQICFKKHEDFIFYLYDELHWNIKNVSSDGYNSDQLKQNIILHGIGADYITADGAKNKVYPTLQRVLYDKHMKILNIALLKKELIELDINNDKQSFDHPLTGSKDMSDSLGCAVQNLINHRSQEEFVKNQYAEEDLSHEFNIKIEDKQEIKQKIENNSKTEQIKQNVYNPYDNFINSIIGNHNKQNDEVDMEYFRF